MKISPLAWCPVLPVRPSPRPARRASRRQAAESSGPSVTTTTKHEPAGPATSPGGGRSDAPTGTPATVSRSASPKFASTRTPTVCPDGTRRDDEPMPPFQSKHDIPVPAPMAPSSGGSTVPTDSAGRGQRLPDVVMRDLHASGVAEERVVALRDHGDDHVLHADRRLLVTEQLAGRVVDPSDLHRRGEEHRRLHEAPLLHGDEPGALACAVDHRTARRHGGAEAVAARVEHRHAGAGDPATARWRRLVTPHREMPETHARDVEDRRRRARGEESDPDRQISSARHA